MTHTTHLILAAFIAAAGLSGCGDDDASDGTTAASNATSNGTAATSNATTGGTSNATTGGTTTPPMVDPVRFAIEVTNDVPESIWVQLNYQSGTVAWVTVTPAAGGTPVALEESCAIPDCDDPNSGVCGAALPMVQDITGGAETGSIAFSWSRLWSRVEDQAMCEIRELAPDGDYVARFCWSLGADVESNQGDPTMGVPGEVTDEICADVPFTIPDDTEVVHTIEGG